MSGAFTEHMLEESGPVFDAYYKAHPNIKIVRAYLTYSAYGYLMKNFQMKEGLFQCMEIEMDQMDRGRDICSLAMLKYFFRESSGGGRLQWMGLPGSGPVYEPGDCTSVV